MGWTLQVLHGYLESAKQTMQEEIHTGGESKQAVRPAVQQAGQHQPEALQQQLLDLRGKVQALGQQNTQVTASFTAHRSPWQNRLESSRTSISSHKTCSSIDYSQWLQRRTACNRACRLLLCWLGPSHMLHRLKLHAMGPALPGAQAMPCCRTEAMKANTELCSARC